MSASIQLTKVVKKTQAGTISLTLTTVGTNISSKIFAIEVLPNSADPQAPQLRFSHICSPAELIEFPEDVPQDNCYFRTDSIELIFDTEKMLPHVMSNMTKDIKKLVDEYNRIEAITPGETEVIIIS